MAIDYKQAGVDVNAGYRAVELMKQHVKSTFDKNVLGDIGSFGGAYALDDKPNGDVLIAGTDGVGTKLKYAFATKIHDTIGIDCVAMCVNDVVCQGARPLIFLDYIASGAINPEHIESIVKGVAEGCRQAGAALIGGETAEMPGFYETGEYDIAGFSVGIVKRDRMITGKEMTAGDVLIGLPSSGAHSNGFSLIRKLFPIDDPKTFEHNDYLGGIPAELLLTPTRIYVKTALALIDKVKVKGIAHITGGGFIENIPRIFPDGLMPSLDLGGYEVPKLFKEIQRRAEIEDEKMLNTFNMGIGMVFAVGKDEEGKAMDALRELGENPVPLGTAVKA